jgi:hypothetical protein
LKKAYNFIIKSETSKWYFRKLCYIPIWCYWVSETSKQTFCFCLLNVSWWKLINLYTCYNLYLYLACSPRSDHVYWWSGWMFGVPRENQRSSENHCHTLSLTFVSSTPGNSRSLNSQIMVMIHTDCMVDINITVIWSRPRYALEK